MASRSWKRDGTLGVGIRRVYMRFFPDGTTTPLTPTDPGGTVASVAYASGTYTITLKDTYLSIVGCFAQYQSEATNVDMYCQIGDIDLSAKTIVIQLKTAGTNTQPAAADANHSIFVELVFQESTVTT